MTLSNRENLTNNSSISISKYSHCLETLASWLAVATAFFIPLSTSVTDILFVVCPLLVCLAGRWREKFNFIWQRRAAFLLLVLFAWMLVGMTYTEATSKDAWMGLVKYDKLLLGGFFIGIFIDEKWRRYALHAFLAAILVTLLAALLTALGCLNSYGKFGHLLVFKDRIQTSFLMAMAAYFSGALFFEYSATKLRWFYAAVFFISVFFLFSSEGRSGYLVFFALLIWLLWDHWRWRGAISAVLAIVAVLVAAYLFSPAFNGRWQESIHDLQIYQSGQDNTSLGLRAEFAKNSIRLVKQHPLLGTGTGSFSPQYASLNTPAYLETRNPHNQYIHILVQWGAVGLLLLLWAFYTQWRDSYMLALLPRRMAQGTVLAIVFGSLANSWLLDTTEGHFYVYFIMLAFASQIKPKPLIALLSSK